MYRFTTKEGKEFVCEYSPKQIAKFIHFDAFDSIGDRFVIETQDVDFTSFEFIQQSQKHLKQWRRTS